MKKSVLLIFVYLLTVSAAMPSSKAAGAQDWIREPDNPVFSPAGGNWDGYHIAGPSVLADGIYKMWYTGADQANIRRMGYATSPDGIIWTRYQGNNCLSSPEGNGCVFDIGGSSSWDGLQVYSSSILKDPNAPPDERYKMWYTGVDTAPTFEERKWRTGYAVSPDGITWTRYNGNNCLSVSGGNGCVLDVGVTGSWDDDVVGAPSVMIDPGAPAAERYKMWYEGCLYNGNDPKHICRIGYAVSPDGISWTKYQDNTCPTNLNGNGCVFDLEDNGNWDDVQVIQPSVLMNANGQYEMWYAGKSSLDSSIRIGHAISSDGTTWTRYRGNHCLTSPAGLGCIFDLGSSWWENSVVYDPHVIKVSDGFIMWYTGSQIGLAYFDNCPEVSNPDQMDSDADGIGNACDACPNSLPVRIAGATPEVYVSLQTAYDESVENDTIQSQAGAFNENLYIDSNKTAILDGGYTCDYTFKEGSSALNGNLSIEDGSVSIEDFIIR